LYFEEEEEEEKRISSAQPGRGIHKAQQLSFVFLFVIMQPASRLKRIFLFSFFFEVDDKELVNGLISFCRSAKGITNREC
jgi:hypothetical protein